MSEPLWNRDFAVTLQSARSFSPPLVSNTVGNMNSLVRLQAAAAVANRGVRIAARPQELGRRDFGRGTLSRPTLRVSFKVEKNTGRDPNKAEVSIYNLTKDSRKAIQGVGTYAEIEAGYVNRMFKIFVGDLTYSNHTRSGVDWITSFQSADGGKEYRAARIQESMAPGTRLQDAAIRAAKSFGLGMGNVQRTLDAGGFRGGLTQYKKGITLSGQTSDVFDSLMRTFGMEWSIQDGQIQIAPVGQPFYDEVVVLRPETGLIGSPELSQEEAEKDKPKKSYVKLRTLMQGDISPGKRIQVFSETFNGELFRAEKVSHVGDTWGQDWYTDVEATALG